MHHSASHANTFHGKSTDLEPDTDTQGEEQQGTMGRKRKDRTGQNGEGMTE